ncbi:MAG: hypothetical protein JKY22_09885, partial [Flavobacteriaceae bacterium]|nr:hypothetical protein [Flavobacteriaceae bacterium]
MKKLFFLCLFGLLLSCSSDDKNTTTEIEVDLTIDHYKTTSLLHGTAFVVSENGAERQFQIPVISGFDFQQGFRYQLRAKRITTVN